MNEIKTGTCVYLKGLKKAEKYNKKPGLVKKCMDNGRFRVLLNGGNEIAVKPENLENVNQCPNESRRADFGVLCWPKLYDREFPSLQWIEYEEINRHFSNNVDMINPDSKNLENYLTALKNILGWEAPKMWYHDGYQNNTRNILFYDEASTAPENTWIHTRLRRYQTPKIRGAFIQYQDLISNKQPIPMNTIVQRKINFNIYDKHDVESWEDKQMQYQMTSFIKSMYLADKEYCHETNETCKNCIDFVMEVNDMIHTLYPGGLDEMSDALLK